jgi:hypothetical protein
MADKLTFLAEDTGKNGNGNRALKLLWTLDSTYNATNLTIDEK